MADEITKTESVNPGQGASEVIRLDGKAGPSTSEQNLTAMFDLAEKGSSIKDAEKQVMAKAPKKPEPKPEPENVEPIKEDKPSGLDAELQKRAADKDAEKAKEDEDAREALNKKPEHKEDKPKTDKTSEKTDDEVPDEELQVLPQDKPKTAKRIQALLKRIEDVTTRETETKKERDAKDAELKKLQEQLQQQKSVSPEVNEEIKKQLDELKVYRRRYALDNDPEVKERFDGRIASAETTIAETLKKYGANDSLLKTISDEGGWLKFASSNSTISMRNENGELEAVPAAEAARRIMSVLNLADQKLLDAASVEQIATKRERDRFFETETKNASEYFRKKEEEAKQGTEAYQKQVESVRKAIDDFRQKTLAEEMFKEKEVPVDATPEQKQAIEADNAYTKQIKQVFEKNLKTGDVDGMLQIAKESALYFEERRNTQRLLAKVSKLENDLKAANETISKHKLAGKSTPKSGSISPTAQSSAPAARQKATPISLEEALAFREEGKLSDDGKVTEPEE